MNTTPQVAYAARTGFLIWFSSRIIVVAGWLSKSRPIRSTVVLTLLPDGNDAPYVLPSPDAPIPATATMTLPVAVS